MIRMIRDKIREQSLFFISLFVSLCTSIFVYPRISAIDWKVVFSLANLMLICLAFEKYRFLDKIAVSILNRFRTPRTMGMAMIPTTALLAMFITNDVSLITVVPLTIITARKAGFTPYKLVTLETVAANIGSSLTPFGNPQNLYLYAFYKIRTLEFLRTMFPFTLVGLVLLFMMNLWNDKAFLSSPTEYIKIKNKKKLAFYLLVFILVILSIIRILDYRIITFFVIMIFLLLDRSLLPKVDYYLLGVFICFFIFIDNLSRLGLIQHLGERYLSSPLQVYTLSAFLSQFISNVPAAILLSGFTSFHGQLLVGVNLGGLGSLIASLANLISYKFYIKEYDGKPFRRYFIVVNVILFIVLYFFMTIW